MNNNDIVRVHYYKEQFLRTDDFREEQDYHLAMRRRHNLAHHTWGVAYGLEVASGELQDIVDCLKSNH